MLTGPLTVTITGVKQGNREQPIIVELEGMRPYKPCKSMRRVLIAAYSDDPHQWVGKRMTLFCDPDVMWAGIKAGGIRISHLSGLREARTFLLTQSRKKRAEYRIQPLGLSGEGEPDKPKFTDIKGWDGVPVELRPAVLEKLVRPLYDAKNLTALRGSLAKLDTIATDFQPHDLESLRGMVGDWISELEKKAGDTDG